MAVAYPTGIAQPLVGGYSNIDSQHVRSNDVETGPPRFELLSDHGPVFFKVSWIFRAVDFQLFEGWYKHDLTLGANAFELDVKVGAGLKTHDCYFLKPYKSSLVGKLWKVSADIVGIAKTYDTLADYEALKAISEAIDGDLTQWIDQFNNLVEQVMPDALGA